MDPIVDEPRPEAHGNSGVNSTNTYDSPQRRSEMIKLLDDLALYGRTNAFEQLRRVVMGTDEAARRSGFPVDRIPLDWARGYLPALRLINGGSRVGYVGGVMCQALRGSPQEGVVRHKIALSLKCTPGTIEENISEFKFDVPFSGLFALIAVLKKRLVDKVDLTVLRAARPLNEAIDVLTTLEQLILEFLAGGSNSELDFRPFVFQLIDDIVNPQLDMLPSTLLNHRPTLKLAARDRARRSGPRGIGANSDKVTQPICKAYLNGHCRFGAQCKLPHVCLHCPPGVVHPLSGCKKWRMKNKLFEKSYVDKLKAELAAYKNGESMNESRNSNKTKGKK